MSEVLVLIMKNWTTFHQALPELREDQIKEMIDFEMMAQQRKTFIERLHQRYTMLRAKRERAELIGAIK